VVLLSLPHTCLVDFLLHQKQNDVKKIFRAIRSSGGGTGGAGGAFPPKFTDGGRSPYYS